MNKLETVSSRAFFVVSFAKDLTRSDMKKLMKVVTDKDVPLVMKIIQKWLTSSWEKMMDKTVDQVEKSLQTELLLLCIDLFVQLPLKASTVNKVKKIFRLFRKIIDTSPPSGVPLQTLEKIKGRFTV